MYKLERVYVGETIKNFLLKDNLYKSILGVSDIEKWYPDLITTAWFIVYNDLNKIGILALKEFSNNCVEFHGGLVEASRGKDTVNILKYCLSTLRVATPTIKYVTKVNSNNKPCLALLRKYGFVEKTIIKQGYSDGDLVLLGEKDDNVL